MTFHYSYIIMAFGYVISGYYINLIAITSLLLIHELGHYTAAKLLKFKVLKIVIYPFGGITKIHDLINKDINEEILVATSGVIFQFIFYLIIVYLNHINIIRDYTLNIYTLYNNQIIFFNLMPIYPLDGSKIINLLLSKFFNYNLSNKLTIIISLMGMSLFILTSSYNHNYSYIMVLSVLIIYNYKFIKQLKYIYNKFLLERYLYNINYPKIKIINNGNKMYKNNSHIIKVNNNYITEKKYLSKYYFK